MNQVKVLLVGCLLIIPSLSLAGPKRSLSKYRGWDYLVGKLLADGMPRSRVESVYRSRRMPIFDFVTFKLAPKEPRNIYRGFLSSKKIKMARAFRNKYRTTLKLAEKQYGVPHQVIVAILLVETQFGKNTGKQMILNRLSRLANIADPTNVKKNYLHLKKSDSKVTLAAVKDRAKYLETTFYPEIKALFKIADSKKINIFNIRGSYAGAFGLPQFLPTSFLRFAVDGSRNGKVSLFETSDAIYSVGNYLSNHGWKGNPTEAQKRKAIWAYNKSEPYIDTILGVARTL